MGVRAAFNKLIRGYQLSKKSTEETVCVKKETTGLERLTTPLPIEIINKEEERNEETRKKKIEDGVEVPEFKISKVKIGSIESEVEEEEKISLTYPLIPSKPKKNEPIFAYTKIEFDPRLNKYYYQVIEPEITRNLRKLLYKIKDLLEQKLDIDFSRLKKWEAKEYLHTQTSKLLDYFGIKLTEEKRRIMMYYIDRDFIGLGKIEPLMHDPDIEDISCDGVDIPLFVFHRNPRLGSVITNIKFETSDELDSFITRLAQLCGKSISIASPILDGSLPDGSRVQATLATDIARRGSNFTIRKFTEEPLTPAHLLNWETVDVRTLAYLWMTVDYGSSIIISGGTATGKTSFLNILSLFIRPENKIVSIEDTPEIRLAGHPHWIPHVARTPISEKGKSEIDMFTLLKESLRQRPDYIIVGEVRGREAYVMFQQMAVGHPALATIHADSLEKLVDRLITPPIELPASLIENLDIVVFLVKIRYRGRYVRKLTSILEIVDFDTKKNRPIINEVFRWNAHTNRFETINKSFVLKKITKKTGLTPKQIKEELERRMLILSWIQERNLTDFQNVADIINLYYNYPERVIAAISGEI